MNKMEFLNKFLVEVTRPDFPDGYDWTRYDFVDVYNCRLEVYSDSLEAAALMAMNDTNYNWEK